MKFGAVVLTTGQRPQQLDAAIKSIRRQSDANADIVVVLNAPGRQPLDIDGPVRVEYPGRNLGIPAGRNLGVAALPAVDAVLFLDDDAEILGDEVLARAAAEFQSDPELAVVTLRVVDPQDGTTLRRHVPRLVVGDPARSSWVTTFLGGACIIRREAFVESGGLPDEFFYAHEETSLAWRLLNQRWRIRYRGDLCVAHPASQPSRHQRSAYYGARNRALLARKHLPSPFAQLYVANWIAVSVLRAPRTAATVMSATVEGLRMREVVRDPISWRTIRYMTMLGRPPLV